MLKVSIDNGPYQFKPEITVKDTDGITDIRRPQKIEDLAGQDKLRYDSDIKVVNILLLGLPVDIYTLINHYQTGKEIRDRIKELMEGIYMTKQERESMLYDEFDKFTYEPGESIYSYYLRYVKLINDMKMIPISTQLVLLSSVLREIDKRIKLQEQRLSIQLEMQGQINQWLDATWIRHKNKKVFFGVGMGDLLLNEEQQDILADSLEETDDYGDL
ncbi:hypothetical protein Tco_0027269 [Tanacetum coccineum]